MPRRVIRHAVVQPADTSIRLIPLTQGQNAIVDSDDYEITSPHSWYALWNPSTENFYAWRRAPKNSANERIAMHRFVLNMEPSNPLMVDHKNGNPLDNRKSNLRIATVAENNRNCKRRSDNLSGYKGVYWKDSSNKWAAHCRFNNKGFHIGYFKSKLDAAQAYILIAYLNFGEFSRMDNQ